MTTTMTSMTFETKKYSLAMFSLQKTLVDCL